jgi:hypothetical protein
MERANPLCFDPGSGTMKAKIGLYLAAFGRFLLRKVLVFDLGVVIIVALSFVIWKGFSLNAFSDRMIYAAIGFFLVSGILVMAQTTGGRNYGVSGQFITPTHAQALTEWNIEIRQDIERRFDFRFQIFLIGIFAFLIGMLIQVLTQLPVK